VQIRTVVRVASWFLALCLAAAGCRGSLEALGDGSDVDAGSSDNSGSDGGAGPAADANPSPAPDAEPEEDPLGVEERALLDTINEERRSRGLGEVVLRNDLTCAAARHSLDIGTTGSCGHTGSDWSSPGDRVSACEGPDWSGEIVACGQSTARDAVDAWIYSPGHNAIMFDGAQRYAGVAMHQNYWTAIFDD